MANVITPEDFRSAGELPQGPVSAWPRERHEQLLGRAAEEKTKRVGGHMKTTNRIRRPDLFKYESQKEIRERINMMQQGVEPGTPVYEHEGEVISNNSMIDLDGERSDKTLAENLTVEVSAPANLPEPKVKASLGQMAKGFAQTAISAAKNGGVSKEIREERIKTCEGCPFFNSKQRRCTECGCFMDAKTWVKAPKAELCPKDRWLR